MDKGVIGMSAFIAKDSSITTYNINQQENGDYAQAGEWGNLSEQDRISRIEEMDKLRKTTNEMASYGGKGRKPAMAIIALIALIMNAKNNGYLPEFLNKLFPTSKQIIGTIIAGVTYLIYQKRAPALINPADPLAPTHLPLIGCSLSILYGVHVIGFNNYVYNIVKAAKFRTVEISAMAKFRIIAVMDPIDRKYMLKDNWRNFIKNIDEPEIPIFQFVFSEVMGRGIFAVDKREWQDHRKVASTMFSVNGLRSQMEHVFLEHGNKLVKLLETYVDTGKVIDLQMIFQAFTFDTICEIAFGIDTKSLDASISGNKSQFLVSFDHVQCITSARFFDPVLFTTLKKSLAIGSESTILGHAKYVVEYVDKVIRDRREAGDFATRKDLLSLYVAHARKTGQTYMEGDEYLRDVILNFMIAGRDTTSCTLTNWMKLLFSSPNSSQVLTKLINESDKKIPLDRDPKWEAILELTYGDAVFNETIRLYPPVGNDLRFAENDDVLPSSGFQVKKGTFMVISNMAIGRDPSLWTNPDSYDPERWVSFDENGEMKKIRRVDEYVMPVFWAGPRLCLGKDMARFEAKLVSMLLLRKYRFEILPHSENVVSGPVIFYVDGLPAKIVSIKN